MSTFLIIFDLDGTLIDSEALCNQALVDLLPSIGASTEELMDRYRGRKLADIFSDIEQRISIRLPDDFEARYRQRVADLFETELRPFEGVSEMLRAIEHSFCVASSGPPDKIRHALSITGIAQYFDERLFSSYVVGSWKPDPGLFLYAAAEMGFAPERCVVVEDSAVGVEAAAAAGMRALRFSPDLSLPRNANSFATMSELTSILRAL